MRVVSALLATTMIILPTGPRAQDGLGVLSDEVREARETAGLVGMGAGIVIDGEIVAIAVDGDRQLGQNTPISQDAVWHLGSVTKSMTATLMATLVEEGRLSFDTTVGDVYGSDAHESWQGVTLSQLLTHRSGAPRSFGLIDMLSPDPATDAKVMTQRQAKIRAIIGRERPGEVGDYAYSNVGFTIAGAMAERLTGQPWEELMVEHVFGPLGITPTYGAPKGPDAPWGHGQGLFGKSRTSPSGKADNPRFIGPAGNVALPLEDFLRYGRAHLEQDDVLLARSSYDILQTPPYPEEETGQGYAYGWVVDPTGAGLGAGPVIWHNGSNTMWYALLLLLPEQNAVIAITSNDGDTAAAEPAAFDLATQIVRDFGLGD